MKHCSLIIRQFCLLDPEMTIDQSSANSGPTHPMQLVTLPDKHSSPIVTPLLYATQVPLSTEQQAAFALTSEVSTGDSSPKGWPSQLDSLQGNLEYHTLLSAAPGTADTSHGNTSQGY